MLIPQEHSSYPQTDHFSAIRDSRGLAPYLHGGPGMGVTPFIDELKTAVAGIRGSGPVVDFVRADGHYSVGLACVTLGALDEAEERFGEAQRQWERAANAKPDLSGFVRFRSSATEGLLSLVGSDMLLPKPNLTPTAHRLVAKEVLAATLGLVDPRTNLPYNERKEGKQNIASVAELSVVVLSPDAIGSTSICVPAPMDAERAQGVSDKVLRSLRQAPAHDLRVICVDEGTVQRVIPIDVTARSVSSKRQAHPSVVVIGAETLGYDRTSNPGGRMLAAAIVSSVFDRTPGQIQLVAETTARITEAFEAQQARLDAGAAPLNFMIAR